MLTVKYRFLLAFLIFSTQPLMAKKPAAGPEFKQVPAFCAKIEAQRTTYLEAIGDKVKNNPGHVFIGAVVVCVIGLAFYNA